MARKIVIASGKGGVGKTSLTVGFGKALSSFGFSVLLIDFDSLRSIDLLVNATETLVYDWGDVIMQRCDINDAIYKSDDVCVITCPRNYDSMNENKIRWLFNRLEKKFDYILIDAPAGIDRGLRLACACADRGIVVSTPDLVCVRSAGIAAEEMHKMGVSDIRLVINRASKKDIVKGRLLNIDEVIDSTEVQLIGVVPEDPKIRFGAMGVSIYKKGQLSYKEMTNICRRIVGENVPLQF